MSKIGYLGPEGSYSEIAAERIMPEAEKVAYQNFPLLMKALLSKEADVIVAPIENSINGGVLQNIDLLQSTDGVCAVQECVVHIDHRLATMEGAPLSGIKRIYSHQQALDQCARYINANYPTARLIATSSTAAGIQKIQSPEDAGICGSHMKAEGITLSGENIADEKNNFTHFLLVVRGAADPAKPSRKIYFSFTCRHEPGALFKILKCMADDNVNMTKIESRPIKDKPGEYRFFIEIEGDYSNAATRKTLGRVADAANSFKILGAY
ncbi:MAG: ACT domain-containing protein [Clostridia bacterium]|nr:ACT domain-containing protein [Clostridia bacterium]